MGPRFHRRYLHLRSDTETAPEASVAGTTGVPAPSAIPGL